MNITLKKSKKGIQLNQAFTAVLVLVSLGVLVIMAIFIFVSLGDSSPTTTTSSSQTILTQSTETLTPIGDGITSSNANANNQTWLEFDGVDDRINIGDTPSLNLGINNFSFSVWIKTNVSDGELRGIISKEGVDPRYYLGIIGGKIRILADDSVDTVYRMSNTDVSDNKWYHIVATVNRTAMNIYLDGVLDNGALIGNPVDLGNINNNNDFAIGVIGIENFNGSIEDIRMYNYSLTSDEVSKIYYRGKKGIDEEFTLVHLTDTQYYSSAYPQVFNKTTQWVKDNRNILNFIYLSHTGDIEDGNGNITQLDRANESMSILDGFVPYGVVYGNHDVNGLVNVSNHTTYNQYWGLDRFNTTSTWGGTENVSNADNTYQLFNASGMPFIIFNIGFCPNNDTLSWVNETAYNYGSYRAIFTTHYYLSSDNSLVDVTYNCSRYKTGTLEPEDMWGYYLKYIPNLFLILSGHVGGDGIGYRSDVGVSENIVHSVMTNPQQWANGGDGYLRLFTFVPSKDLIKITAYSTNLSIYDTSSDLTFNISYSMDDYSFNEYGTLAYWKFNENSGTTAHDLSGNGNDGTLIGVPTWQTDGLFALLTEGVDYSIGATTGLFTILNSDLQWSEMIISWDYISSSGIGATDDLIEEFSAYTSLIGLVGIIIFLSLVITIIVGSFIISSRKV